jgi:hypothetical protein
MQAGWMILDDFTIRELKIHPLQEEQEDSGKIG